MATLTTPFSGKFDKSTKFGSGSSDVHQITGSVQITGSLFLDGVPVGGGGAVSPGGSDTYIQFNNNGSFSGSSQLITNGSGSLTARETITAQGWSQPQLVIGDCDALGGFLPGQIKLCTGNDSGNPAYIENSGYSSYNLILSGTNKIIHQTVNGSEFYKGGTKIVDIGVTADTLVATKLSSSFISNDYFSASISTATNASCSVYNIFNYDLGASLTLTALNPVAGASYLFFLRQGGGGTNVVTFSSEFKWPGGTAPTLSTAAGAVDIVSGISDGTNIYADTTKDFS